MTSIIKDLILQTRKLVNFIVLEGESKEFYICAHWRFKTPEIAVKSSSHIYGMYKDYLKKDDFIGMDMCRKFLEMGFTRSRRYANHHTGKKYDNEGNVTPQEPDHATCKYAKSAKVFKEVRDIVAKSDDYVRMRKQWRASE